MTAKASTVIVCVLVWHCLASTVAWSGVEPDPAGQARALVRQGLALNDNSVEEEHCYRKASSIDPTYAAAFCNLAFVLHSRGDLENALAPYKRCLDLDPGRADMHENYAMCLLSVRKDAMLPAVRRHLNSAIELYETRSPTQRPTDLQAKKAKRLAVEKRLADTYPGQADDQPDPQRFTRLLARNVLRNTAGQGLYDGPRLALLLFNAGQARLNDRSKALLRALAKALNSPQLHRFSFVIEGHADGRGMAAANLALSRRRSLAVKHWLATDGGVDPRRLRLMAVGEDRPLTPNVGLASLRQNRRIEIIREDAYD